MSLRNFLLSTVSHPSIRAAMPRMTAREMANALAWAYGGLHLGHVKTSGAIQ